ncbi:tetratricopeptide repeat-containing sensor histidine kinase [Algoriphagus sp. PAP.12]|uniref:tetratricopeptide repeat-containing sensor histidine kinase n=1 Tax=Algoriphagus sp. PAP.12 TaxID=2996678 RepID=UPI00227C6279|nr:histidine kinase [Algoriphagus sp. PAP.12]
MYRKPLLFFLLFLPGLALKAQYHFQELSPETIKHFQEAKNCWDNTEESCIRFYKNFVQAAVEKNECIPCTEIELARGYYFESYLDSCLLVLDRVLEKTPHQKDTLRLRIELDAYNLIGSVLNQQGKQQEAIEAYLACGERIQALDLQEHEALMNVNLGLLYLNMDDNRQAINLFKSALQTLEKLGISRQTAIINRNLALAYLAEEQLDSMLQILPKTLQLAKEQKSINSEIGAYSLFAEAYELQYPDSSLYYADKAIELADQSNRPHEKAGALFSKANVLINQGNYQQAKPYYLESIDLYTNTQRYAVIRRLYRQLGKSAFQHKDYEIAARYLNLYATVSDSIADQESQKIVRDLNTKYETAKKENLINEQELQIQKEKTNTLIALFTVLFLLLFFLFTFLFIRKNHRIKLKQAHQEKEQAILAAFIQGEERERNRISYELHDGVAAMISAAKMTLGTLTYLSDEKQKEQISKIASILTDTHQDIRHIAHNLLPTTLEEEGLVQAIKQFVSEINESNLIHFSVLDQQSKAHLLSRQLQLMLFRIIQELVNNIIKHSQARNATILFSTQNKNLFVEITDDGIGYQAKEKGDSQGLFSIQQRLHSIGGDFSIKKKNDKGTQVIVQLDIP